MEFYSRATWTGTVRPVAKLVHLDPSMVKGVAVHYTGSTARLGETASMALSCQRLEAERKFHTDPTPGGRGWSDIAYGAAIDVEGRVFDCRGIEYRSAANGDVPVNMAYGACTWLLGVGDTPTTAMTEAFKWWRETYWLPMYPHATAVVGHRDLYGTNCPGDPVYALVRSGDLTQPAGDDMPLTDAEIDAIALRTRDKILAVTYGTTSNGAPHTLGNVLGETLTAANEAANDVAALTAKVDALTAAVHALATAGTPVTLTAAQVAAIGSAAKTTPDDVVNVLALRLAPKS